MNNENGEIDKKLVESLSMIEKLCMVEINPCSIVAMKTFNDEIVEQVLTHYPALANYIKHNKDYINRNDYIDILLVTLPEHGLLYVQNKTSKLEALALSRDIYNIFHVKKIKLEYCLMCNLDTLKRINIPLKVQIELMSTHLFNHYYDIPNPPIELTKEFIRHNPRQIRRIEQTDELHLIAFDVDPLSYSLFDNPSKSLQVLNNLIR